LNKGIPRSIDGIREKLAATNLVLQQIRDRKHNKVTFWCGSPKYWLPGKFKNIGAKFQTIFGASPTVWIPHAERSTLVLGAPGSGKTFGTIDRMAESCMAQGFPLIVYDKKGDQMKLLAPLAARYGYKVWIFAPGESYSEVINPLDFMENQEDAVTAAQIAQVINANAGSSGKSDEFFSKAADLLAKALIQLAKGSDRPDLAMVYCIQSTDGFINKLHAAVQAGRVLILTLHDSKETVLTAFAAGADSYCMKDIRFQKLIEAIHLTYQGDTWIDPAIAKR
jgi:type IV secretion system protein VirD4